MKNQYWIWWLCLLCVVLRIPFRLRFGHCYATHQLSNSSARSQMPRHCACILAHRKEKKLGTRKGSPHSLKGETHKFQTSLLLTSCWPEDSHATIGDPQRKAGKCNHGTQLKIRGFCALRARRRVGDRRQESLSQGSFLQFLLCFGDIMEWPPGLFISPKTLVPVSVPSSASYKMSTLASL